MNLADASTIAQELVKQIAPACDRCEIAGGVRRGKQDPHDIEIVVLPVNKAPRAEFGQKMPVHKNMLERRLWEMEQERLLTKVSGADKLKKFDIDPEKFGVSVVTKVRFELYIVTPPAEWGPLFTIRTGPSEFSHWLVTPRKLGGRMPDGYIQHKGAVWPGQWAEDVAEPTGDKLAMPEEIDFLRFLGLDWIEPKDRKAQWGQS